MSKFNGFEVGQKFRVDDRIGFGYTGVSNGDVMVIECQDCDGDWIAFKHGSKSKNRCIVTDSDIQDGNVTLINKDEEQTGEQSVQISADIVWQMIQGSGEYNGHFQVSLPKADMQTLKELARCLEKHLETISESTGTLVEIRLLPESDYNWSASLYQLGYWSTGEHINGDTDRLLMSIDNVTGV